MKQHWQKLQQKIDALSLRERALAFAAAAFVVVTLINTMLLDPLFVQQKQMAERATTEQDQLAKLQSEIHKRVRARDIDPDAPNRERLKKLREQLSQSNADLRSMHKGLVSPDKMSGLLEDLLRRHGKLQLVSLKTLPPAVMNNAATSMPRSSGSATAGGAPAENGSSGQDADSAIYKHGVEITVQGSYPDMMSYLAQLEAMPWQLFWGAARLNADSYPKATLTMTLFTLSLDRKWLNI